MPIPAQEHTKHTSPFSGFLPFFWLASACIGGIWLADKGFLPLWFWWVGFIFSLAVWSLTVVLPENLALTHILRQWTKSEQRLPWTILAAIFFLGGWRYSAAQISITPRHTAYYNERGAVQLVGVLVEPPDPRDAYVNLTVQVDTLRVMEDGDVIEVSGAVLVQVQPGRSWAYGDLLQITGTLETPFEGADFSYRTYLARRGIYSIMPFAQVQRLAVGEGSQIKAVLFRLRDRGYDTLQRLFPSPESDLLAGIVLGRDHGLSKDLQKAFQKTGTTHIIAISGFNIAILAGLFSGVFTRLLGRKWGALTSIFAIAGFTILVGGEAAVVRAAIMGSLGVLGGMFGKRQNGLNSIGLAVLVMILINPNMPWDIGFQLSVAATLGLVLFAQPLEEKFVQFASRKMPEEQAHKLVGPVSEFFLFTLAAQVMTLPIMAFHFGDVSWLALIANPLVLPPQSLVLILGSIAMISGMLLPGLGAVMAVLALPFVRYTIRMVIWLGRFPGGDLILPKFHPLWLVLFYGVLFVVTLVPKEGQQKIYRAIFSFQSGLLLLTGLVVFTWNRVLTVPDGNLHLTMLDAEGTVLVQTPAGNAILVGGGASPSHLNQMLGELLPAGKQKIDVLIVGSAARDDLNGLTGGLMTANVEMALWGIDPGTNQTSRTVYGLSREKEIPMVTMEPGLRLEIGEGISLEVLWTGERGAVLWLEWENFSALLPTGKVADHWLLVPGAPDFVLLPDDLAADDLPLQRINDWSPSVLLLPLEKSELPLEGQHELITLLADYPLVTSLDYGWVRVSTDGYELWVQGERNVFGGE